MNIMKQPDKKNGHFPTNIKNYHVIIKFKGKLQLTKLATSGKDLDL